MISSFHLNGHNLGFYPQTQKLEPLMYSTIDNATGKKLLSSFHLNGNTLRFYPQTQKLELLM